MKNLIIYYSRRGQNYVNGSIKSLDKGNAELITEFIQNAVDADVFEVDTVKPYDKDYMVCIEEAKAELRAKARPELKEMLSDISEYVSEKKYDCVIVPYSTFQCIYPTEKILNMLHSIHNLLIKGGYLLIDLSTHFNEDIDEDALIQSSGGKLGKVCD